MCSYSASFSIQTVLVNEEESLKAQDWEFIGKVSFVKD
jgi:hypothetical protein